MPKHHTCWTVIAGRSFTINDDLRLFCSVQFFRYSPAPISIKHLLEHGKTNDNMVSTQRIKSGLWSFFFTFQGSFHFLKKEIPTRLANMIMELKLLPKDLMNQRECTEILSDYISSFKCVKNNQITTQLSAPALQGDGEVWGQTGKGTGPGTILRGHQHNQVAPWLGNKEEKVWYVQLCILKIPLD